MTTVTVSCTKSGGPGYDVCVDGHVYVRNVWPLKAAERTARQLRNDIALPSIAASLHRRDSQPKLPTVDATLRVVK